MAGIIDVIDKIKSTVTGIRPKFPVFPAMLMACSLAKRPGLSVNVSVANIISSLKKQGFKTEKGPDGQPNMTTKYTHTIVKEMFRAINEDGAVKIALPIGSITVQATGANAGGPVTCVGFNITDTTASGLMG